ncbi:hypothetical protein SAMN04515665_12527 [Blastococcus sp. DSM 46786]|uniref:hypothetical protein n=1 Tax=Blastococcus sp. DSM 46786 TaxID=1798227 RepID=UPI0008C6CEDF|nr:hypothetical protein [Blastococcus sp. DSM 46786]SEL98608.1 hypothetical protein SAMN04515665_12527 [Blastococcus sp. DSM 46786]
MRLLVPAAVLLAVAGCSGGGGGTPPAPSPDAAGIGAAVEAGLLARDDVAAVEFRYKDTATDPASSTVDVTAEPGADPRAIHEEAVRLVWQSALQPLNSIGVNVVDPQDPVRGLSEVVDLLDPADTMPLEERYGSRPG